jgi:hypothetical protein
MDEVESLRLGGGCRRDRLGWGSRKENEKKKKKKEAGVRVTSRWHQHQRR